MVMLAILVLGATWWLVSALSAPQNRAALQTNHNARVLEQAKSALIGYVAHKALLASERHPGRLPCPESAGVQNNHNGTTYLDDDDGIASGSCTLPAVGRRPWRTLGMDKLVDAAGEPLWYVVSPGWTLAFPTDKPIINSDTPGQLTLDGQAAVAFIIAPGRALSVQASGGCAARDQRRVRQPNVAWDLRDFLECSNATSPPDATFVSNGPSESFNDQVVAVTAREIWLEAEGAVAARIRRDVLPALEAALGAPYTSSAQWGGTTSATNPMLPFALSFAGGATQPYQGSLPLWRSQGCIAGTDPYCDPTFVQWAINDADQVTYPNPSAIKTVFGSTTADITGTPDCVSSSTPQTVTCSLSYTGSCGGFLALGYLLGGRCWMDLQVSVRARARNVGRAVRTFTAAPIAVSSSPWSFASSATPITGLGPGAGTAAADIRVNLPPASCACTLIICILIPCTATETVTLTIPIAVFDDHPALTAFFATGANQEWFVNNHWYDVMYYAVAPSHAPGGAHDCRAAAPADCLTVTGGNLPADVRALTGLMGFSLNGTARPNATLADYLDSAQNRDGNTVFEQKVANRSFNDRFFAISKY
jgi:hypothetical protein